jgi:hypothetical protein
VLGVQILYKYLPHPDSDLDVPHMDLDLLDETCPIVKSKLYFVVFVPILGANSTKIHRQHI